MEVMFSSLKKSGSISDLDSFITTMNHEVLHREVSSKLKENTPPLEPHTRDHRVVRMPHFMHNMVSSVYSVDRKGPFKDLFLSRLIFDDSLRSEVQMVFDNWKLIENEKDSGPIHVASLSEYNKRQILIAAPIKHVALPYGRSHVYDSPPSSFDIGDYDWLERLADQWKSKLFDGKKIDKLDFSKTHSPRLTSQGLVLKGKGETPSLRFIRKAVQAKLASKYTNHKQIDDFYDRLDLLAGEFGFNFSFRSFITGIRRQQTSKPEPIQSNDVSLPANKITGYSSALQGRVRGIMMPPELSKIFRKPPGDILKSKLFKSHNVFAVSPESVNSMVTAIAKADRDMDYPEDKSVGTVTAYDLSAFDTTQHKGAYDIYQKIMSYMVEDWEDTYDSEFIAKHKLLTTSGVRSDSPVVEYDVKGRAKLSGEPEVTISNNVIAYVVFLQAWSKVLGIDPVELDLELGFNSGSKRKAKIHGDDATQIMSDKFQDYLDFKKEYEKSGFILDYEKVPAYLKKVDSSLFIDKSGKSLPPGTIYGIPGSILKNRFGEYPRSHHAVIVAGLMDTIDLIPSNTNYYDLYHDLCEIIVSSCTPFKTVKEARVYYNSEEFKKDIIEYAKSSISKAVEVKSILDRHYYANGEIIMDDNLAEIYGSLDYSIKDIDDEITLPDSVEGLEDLILEEQRELFRSSGTGTTFTELLTQIKESKSEEKESDDSL